MPTPTRGHSAAKEPKVRAGARDESREDRKAQSRRRILESAREVFFRDGFMAANLDEVAERAGVAKGTLYRYFDSKADLYVAVLAENGKVYLDRMRNAAETGDTATARLESVSRFYLDHWLTHKEYFQIFWAIDNQSVIGALPARVVEEVLRLWEQSLAILEGVLADGVRSAEFVECDTWVTSNILWTTANAIVQSDSTAARRKLRRSSLEDLYAGCLELYIHGLKRRN